MIRSWPRFTFFWGNINLASPSCERGPIEFLISLTIYRRRRRKTDEAQITPPNLGAEKEQMDMRIYLLHVLDEGRLGRLVDFVDLDSLRGKSLLDSEHFYKIYMCWIVPNTRESTRWEQEEMSLFQALHWLTKHVVKHENSIAKVVFLDKSRVNGTGAKSAKSVLRLREPIHKYARIHTGREEVW